MHAIIISSQFKQQILPESFLSAKTNHLLPIPALPPALSSVSASVCDAYFQTVPLESAKLNFSTSLAQNIAFLLPFLEILIHLAGLRWHLELTSQMGF